MRFSARGVLDKCRSFLGFWTAQTTAGHLEAIRKHEIVIAMHTLPPQGRLLEIGAGSGWQARVLEANGYKVDALDLTVSEQAHAVFPVESYDGSVIPFPDRTFDIVFSSNVLEHIPHVREFQAEIRRVLVPGGLALHVVPSATWRMWTNGTHALKYWSNPGRHGEHASNAWTEIARFRRRAWRSLFQDTGWMIEREVSNGLFYTGTSILDHRLSLHARTLFALFLGGSGTLFLLRSSPSHEQSITRAGVT